MSTRRRVPPSLWTDPRHRRGLEGERIAMRFLTSCGWVVEAHRFRSGRHDLDLVVRRGAIVAFVEVKTRRDRRFGTPGQAVDWRKRSILHQVAAVWCLRRGRPGDQYRFDVVEVVLGGAGGVEVEHLVDAWR